MSDKKISELPLISAINAADISLLVSEGTDYKFAFTSLLQFISDNLTIGAKITFGTVLPANTTGKNGDIFVKTDTGAFAQRVSGVWNIVYTIPSSSGTTSGTILYGVGAPTSSTGSDNDTYINTGMGIFYKKSSGAWSQVFSMQTGPQGPQGTAGTNGINGANGFSILNGTTTPSNISTGVNGDFYIKTSTYTLYGPKTGGIWGDGVSLVGTGIPNGGTIGQVLVKNSIDDLDVDWGEVSFANITGDPADNVSLTAVLDEKADLVSGKIPSGQLPSYVDDVLEFADFASLPNPGETSKIYVTLDDNCEYRWSGSTYIQLVASPGSTDAVPEGSTNKYFTASRVLSTVLSGVSFLTNAAVSATDTILAALGKLQAQLNGLSSIFQAKEDQGLSKTNNVEFADIEATGIFKAGRANVGTGLPTDFHGNTAGRFLIAWNRSGSEGETVFANNGGTEPYAVGGFSFIHVDNSGVETEMFKLSGADFAAVFAGRVSPGIIDASTTPATVYLTYNPATKALESRTVAEVASDVGSGGGGLSGLEPKELLFGSEDGEIAQAADLQFDSATNSFYKSVITKPFTSGNIYFFGDSVTNGTGAGSGTRFTLVMAGLLGLTENNNGVPASFLEKRTPVDPSGAVNMIDRISTIPTKGTNDRFIVFVYGINDLNYGGANYTPANFETDYTTVINACISKGWNAQDILITSTVYQNPSIYGSTGSGGGTITLLKQQQFNSAAQNVAEALGTMYFDIFTYISNRGGVFNLADGLHPNAFGHYLMGVALTNVLVRNVYFNDQSFAVSGIVELLDLVLKTKYVVPDAETKILGIDANGNVGFINATPANLKLNSPYLLGGLKQFGALIPTPTINDDFYLKMSTILRAHHTSNDAWFGKIELLDSGACMVFRISYNNGYYRFYGGSDGTTDLFKISFAGILTIKAAEIPSDAAGGDIFTILNKGLGASTGGVQGKFIPLEAGLNTVIKNDYQTGKIQIRVSGGTNGGVLNTWNFNAHGSLEGLVNGQTLIMKSPDGTKYSLSPPNGGGAATWVAV